MSFATRKSRRNRMDERARHLFLESLEPRQLLTAVQPILLGDLNEGEEGSFPGSFVEFNDSYYFTAGETEIWQTDGTEEGTVRVLDKVGETANGPTYLSELHVHDGMLVFARIDRGSVGAFFGEGQDDDIVQLWKSDGTTDGTMLVKDFGVGSNGSSDGAYFNSVGGKLFGIIRTAEAGMELWTTDLTEEGTVLVKDINEGPDSSFPYNFLPFNDQLFFTARDGVHGTELWVTDGTSDGTQLVKDIFEGSDGSYPRELTQLGDKLIFSAGDEDHGTEPWVSDGTEQGTMLLADLETGTYEGFAYGSEPSSFAELNDRLFFTTENSGSDGSLFTEDDRIQLWSTDGTSDGTVLVKDFGADSTRNGQKTVTAFQSVFAAISTPESGMELWKSDGTEAGTQLVKDINPSEDTGYGSNGSFPYFLTEVNGRLYFTADDSVHGEELWVTDGRPNGTVMVKDINPTVSDYPASSGVYPMVSVGGKLFFAADDGVNGSEPYAITPPICDYHNEDDPLDVTKDNNVAPIDALVVINLLNSDRGRQLGPFVGVPTRQYDVNCDGLATPIDALRVINFLNSRQDGEGEAETPIIAIADELDAPLEFAEQIVAQNEIASANVEVVDNRYHLAEEETPRFRYKR